MIEVHVTFASAEEAARLARAVLEARLAACANIVEGVRSLFWWDGQIADEAETLAIFKTGAERAEALEAFIAEHHPYDTPAIIRHMNVGANPAFEQWIAAETTAEGNA
ncbi:divalent cation tolerance protein CutA [Nitratireductor mangrovi]|uniref:Divalent cation tolerance protein CutA n=1 Tax=Nitratireductor mangrovi TaxID=2599600 RepID=A0A5B8KX12_9HYPH|nr:divalent-cation tolerance protein CutA [Nitratireductor mangrovi]QDZ01578.1 divalent cation tolerance protein CutA [Nitratireductor mangrovi]QDZ02134.1 divalent cation tolerance protein CutA [Nitratireductor mangrovi]